MFPACGLPGTAGAERGILAVLAAQAAVALEQRRLAEAGRRPGDADRRGRGAEATCALPAPVLA